MARRALATLLILLLTAAANAAQDLVIPPGSSFGLVPPQGFIVSREFTGFLNPRTRATFLFMELPVADYPKLLDEVTPDALARLQKTLRSREDVTYGGVPGVLVRTEQPAEGGTATQWLLVFRAPAYSGLIFFGQPPNPLHDDASIKAALTSLSLSQKGTLEQAQAALPFVFRETHYLRVILVTGSGTALLAFPDRGKRLLTISRVPAVRALVDRRGYAERLFTESREAANAVVQWSNETVVGGCPGYETVGQGKARGGEGELMLISWIGFCSTGYLRIEGVSTPEHFQADLVEFRALRNSVGPKQ